MDVKCDIERLDQGYQAMIDAGKPMERQTTGDFVRWVLSDIVEEEKHTMTENGFEPRDLGSSVGKICSRYFIERCETL